MSKVYEFGKAGFYSNNIDKFNGHELICMDDGEEVVGVIVSTLNNVYVVDINGDRKVVRKSDRSVINSFGEVISGRRYISR